MRPSSLVPITAPSKPAGRRRGQRRRGGRANRAPDPLAYLGLDNMAPPPRKAIERAAEQLEHEQWRRLTEESTLDAVARRSEAAATRIENRTMDGLFNRRTRDNIAKVNRALRRKIAESSNWVVQLQQCVQRRAHTLRALASLPCDTLPCARARSGFNKTTAEVEMLQQCRLLLQSQLEAKRPYVEQTTQRLAVRARRPDEERVHDPAQECLEREQQFLQEAIEDLSEHLRHVNELLDELEQTRFELAKDWKDKKAAMELDVTCLGAPADDRFKHAGMEQLWRQKQGLPALAPSTLKPDRPGSHTEARRKPPGGGLSIGATPLPPLSARLPPASPIAADSSPVKLPTLSMPSSPASKRSSPVDGLSEAERTKVRPRHVSWVWRSLFEFRAGCAAHSSRLRSIKRPRTASPRRSSRQPVPYQRCWELPASGSRTRSC